MREKPFHEKVLDLVSMIMALIYVGGGIALIFSSSSFRFFPINEVQKYALAAVLIVYGIFRGYRVWRGNNKQEES
jgi:divalent metal cation (Fe/Co/Zn/Cd) transporter